MAGGCWGLTMGPNKHPDVCVCFQDFILQHYSEDGNSYEEEIADLMDLRQVSCAVTSILRMTWSHLQTE